MLATSTSENTILLDIEKTFETGPELALPQSKTSAKRPKNMIIFQPTCSPEPGPSVRK
jgi:hypothetical protein